jgi:hypothetical protein
MAPLYFRAGHFPGSFPNPPDQRPVVYRSNAARTRPLCVTGSSMPPRKAFNLWTVAFASQESGPNEIQIAAKWTDFLLDAPAKLSFRGTRKSLRKTAPG